MYIGFLQSQLYVLMLEHSYYCSIDCLTLTFVSNSCMLVALFCHCQCCKTHSCILQACCVIILYDITMHSGVLNNWLPHLKEIFVYIHTRCNHDHCACGCCGNSTVAGVICCYHYHTSLLQTQV